MRDFPEYVFIDGFVYRHSWNSWYGAGYIRQTSNLRNYPGKPSLRHLYVMELLKKDRAEVVVNPTPNQQIIDTIKYNEWIKNNK